MASTFSPLGVELMVTGENAGTWGTKTNANLNLVEGITGGYVVATLNAAGTGANTTALTVVDGALTGTAQSRVIVLGAETAQAITGNKIVTIPNDIENTYYILNNTTGSYTVQLKYATGSGDTITWATSNKGWKIISATKNDVTNPDVEEVVIAGGIAAVVDDTSPQLGGNLDVNGNDIVSTSNADIDIIPNGTGDVNLGADTVQIGDNNADATLTTQGTGDLILNTNNGTSSGTVTVADGAAGNITIAPNGAGRTKVTNAGPGTSSTQTVTTDGKGIVFSMVFG